MARSASMDGRPVRALRGDPGNPADPDSWPATVPAVAQILAGGLQLAAGLTVLIGENGQASRPSSKRSPRPVGSTRRAARPWRVT